MRNREIRLLQQYTSGPAVGILIRCEPGTGRCSTHVHHAAPSVRRLENISLLPGLDRVRSSGFSRPEVRVWTWGFLIATCLTEREKSQCTAVDVQRTPTSGTLGRFVGGRAGTRWDSFRFPTVRDRTPLLATSAFLVTDAEALRISSELPVNRPLLQAS